MATERTRLRTRPLKKNELPKASVQPKKGEMQVTSALKRGHAAGQLYLRKKKITSNTGGGTTEVVQILPTKTRRNHGSREFGDQKTTDRGGGGGCEMVCKGGGEKLESKEKGKEEPAAKGSAWVATSPVEQERQGKKRLQRVQSEFLKRTTKTEKSSL